MKFRLLLLLPLLVVSLKAASIADLYFKLNSDGVSYSVYACNPSATGQMVIPSTYNGMPVTSIANLKGSITSGAFRGCSSLTSVTIPDSVTSIGIYTFFYCTSLSSITIPDSVNSIGDRAFSFCISLSRVTFEGNAPTMGSDVFLNVHPSIYYYSDATGFTSPTWQGIQTEAISRPIPLIANIKKSENGVKFWFNASSGQSYRIKTSTDLESWTTLEDGIIGEGDTVVRNYDTADTQNRFYRAERNN